MDGDGTAVIIERDVATAMRDGAVLRADIYRPGATGTYPTIMQRIPYGKERARIDVALDLRRGFGWAGPPVGELAAVVERHDRGAVAGRVEFRRARNGANVFRRPLAEVDALRERRRRQQRGCQRHRYAQA